MSKDALLLLPMDFSEYAWEVEEKGCFSGAKINYGNKIYQVNFYDPARLQQEIVGRVAEEGVFLEPNLIVISSVTKVKMEAAVAQFINTGMMDCLCEENSAVK